MESRGKGENIMESVNRRIGSIAVAVALAIGLFSGCSREKTIDYSIEGMEQDKQSGNGGGISDLHQLAEREDWEEKWDMPSGEILEYEGQTLDLYMEVDINAPIMGPKTSQMSVVEVEEPEFSAEYKEEIAKRLFDSGEIYYADYSHLPKKDLQEIRDRLDAGETVYVEFPIREHIEKDAEALDNIENAKETYTPVEDYTDNLYIGLSGGRLYNLAFWEEGGGAYTYRRTKHIVWTVRDIQTVCPEKVKEQENIEFSPWDRGSWVENQCQISEEEARKEAQQFVDRLGLEYSVYSFTYPLLWGEAPAPGAIASGKDWYIDGYVFTFDLGVDGISFVGYGMEEDYEDFYQNKEPTAEVQYSMDARLKVYVTEQGIIRMEADNPLEITHVMDGVGLLPFDTIQGIMRDKMNEQPKFFHFDIFDIHFNEMELLYFRVRDREEPGKFSYVPAWRLAVVTRDELLNRITIRNPVLVNAIDGSLIDFYDET